MLELIMDIVSIHGFFPGALQSETEQICYITIYFLAGYTIFWISALFFFSILFLPQIALSTSLCCHWKCHGQGNYLKVGVQHKRIINYKNNSKKRCCYTSVSIPAQISLPLLVRMTRSAPQVGWYWWVLPALTNLQKAEVTAIKKP